MMKHKALRNVMYLMLLLLVPFEPLMSQGNKTDITSCETIIKILTAMKDGVPEEKASIMLDSTLKSEPYRAMFMYYNDKVHPNQLPDDVFKRMVLSLQYKNKYTKGENNIADQMLLFWMSCYNDLPRYKKIIKQLTKKDLDRSVYLGVELARSWLPPEWEMPSYRFSIVPYGGISAFESDKMQVYDLFQLPTELTGNILWDKLITTIAMESHHRSMRINYPSGIKTHSDSLAFRFISLFGEESTTSKFINNYSGGFVPAIDKSQDSSFFNIVVQKDWNIYATKESEIIERLISIFERAYNGQLTDSELDSEINQFRENVNVVSPFLFIGSELYGAVYYGFGKEGLFTVMRDPRQLFFLYNKAILSNPGKLSRCIRIPDEATYHALQIGKGKRQ